VNRSIRFNYPSVLTKPESRLFRHDGKVRVRTILLLLLCVVGLLSLRVYWLWSTPPDYWQENQQYLQETSSEKRMELAQSVEQRILDLFSFAPEQDSMNRSVDKGTGQAGNGSDIAGNVIGTIGPKQTKVVFVSLNEINAWMDQRLGDWASNQGSSIPDFVSDPMVAFEGENLIFAFKFDRPEFQQVISAVTTIEIDKGMTDKPGQARIRVIKIRTGQLGIPGVKQVSSAIASGSDSSSDLAEAISGIKEAFDGKAFDPLIKINRQKVRMISFKIKHDPPGMELTLKQE